MDEILLIEAVERYLRNEMSAEERSFFEEMRKTNPEVDQAVVENSLILNELEQHASLKAYKHSLNEVELKLIDEGVISKPSYKGKAKVVHFWKKYRRNIAVAACIAGFISVTTAGLIISYNKQENESTKQYLIKKINENMKATEVKVTQIVNSKDQKKAPVIPNPGYRATGFLIDGKGYLVTNAHVVNSLTKSMYVENSKGEYFNAVTVYADKNSDVAIIRISDTSFKTVANLPYSIRKNNLDLAEPIYTLGFPRNIIVYNEGYLSAKSGDDGDSTAYQLTVSVNPGNSGGPVLNRNGEVIGIITSKETNADGVSYAAKAINIFKLLDAIKKADETQNIKLPSSTALRGLERPQQVKKMEDFVYMVVGN